MILLLELSVILGELSKHLQQQQLLAKNSFHEARTGVTPRWKLWWVTERRIATSR
jgi:hypothetical protein